MEGDEDVDEEEDEEGKRRVEGDEDVEEEQDQEQVVEEVISAPKFYL